ncbi:MAG: ATP-binding cassette domain-containing protein, partial [Kiritimatiellia bacterium]
MEAAIEIQELVVEFQQRRRKICAVDGLSLRVECGQVFGFIGPNGAGKTTTMQVLLGFLPATAGTVRVFGRDPQRALARRRLGYMPEHPESYR